MTTFNQGSAEQANLTGTASVQRVCTSTPEQVWAVLADGWAFPSWVVGASRMRAVEPDWPAVGSKLHHSIGTWPAVLDDETQVREETQAVAWSCRRAPGPSASRQWRSP